MWDAPGATRTDHTRSLVCGRARVILTVEQPRRTQAAASGCAHVVAHVVLVHKKVVICDAVYGRTRRDKAAAPHAAQQHGLAVTRARHCAGAVREVFAGWLQNPTKNQNPTQNPTQNPEPSLAPTPSPTCSGIEKLEFSGINRREAATQRADTCRHQLHRPPKRAMQRPVILPVDPLTRQRLQKKIRVTAGHLRHVTCINCGFLLTTGINIAGILPNKNVAISWKAMNDGCAARLACAQLF